MMQNFNACKVIFAKLKRFSFWGLSHKPPI